MPDGGEYRADCTRSGVHGESPAMLASHGGPHVDQRCGDEVAHGAPAGAGAALSTSTLVIGAHTVLVADPAMVQLYDRIDRLARTQLPVLILGESGVGKENVARAVHSW